MSKVFELGENQTLVLWFDGTIEFFLGDVLHRDDGPAVITGEGDSHWFSHGVRHRLDAPAIIAADGQIEYWNRGVLDRKDGPALITKTKKLWFNQGKLIKEE